MQQAVVETCAPGVLVSSVRCDVAVESLEQRPQVITHTSVVKVQPVVTVASGSQAATSARLVVLTTTRRLSAGAGRALEFGRVPLSSVPLIVERASRLLTWVVAADNPDPSQEYILTLERSGTVLASLLFGASDRVQGALTGVLSPLDELEVWVRHQATNTNASAWKNLRVTLSYQEI